VGSPGAGPVALDPPGTAASAHERSRWWRRHPWPTFLVRRVARLVVNLFVLVTISFLMIHAIPGDPVRTALGGITAQPELVAARRHDLGLDLPLVRQYLDYVRRVITGDFGSSIITRQPVSDIIADRLPSTLRLVGLAFLFTILVAYPLGLSMAVLTHNGRHRRGEASFVHATGFVQAIPDFVLATGLVALFAVSFQVLPVAGEDGWTSYVLPVLALTLGSIAALARVIRLEGLRVLDEDYVRTARSKRLPARLVYVRHALPNMLTASLTISGLFLAGLVAGTVLVENVFAWPGLGSTVVQSVIARDYPVALAISLLLGAIALVIHLVVDILLAIADPRSIIRSS
jgi:peptide/nickel transport system permease protein